MTKPDEPAAKIKAREGYLMTFQEPISKRELFAAMALQGLLASMNSKYAFDQLNAGAELMNEDPMQWMARKSVEFADLTLVRLAKGDGG